MLHNEHENTYSRVPLYAAGFGAASFGLTGFSTFMGDDSFTVLTLALLALGFGTSLAVRMGVLPKRIMEVIVLAVLVLTLVMIFTTPQFKYRIIPPIAINAAELTLAVILTWLMVVYSFTLLTDGAVLFLCVPSLSLIGLAATFGLPGRILAHFIAFVCFACFALVQQNALAGPMRRRGESEPISLHVGLTASITVAALILGVVLEQLFYPVFDRALAPSLAKQQLAAPLEETAQETFMPVSAGPVPLSNREVMVVRCSRELLWRGRVFDEYTGQGWWSSISPRDRLQVRLGPTRGKAARLPMEVPSAARGFEIPEDPLADGRKRVRRVMQTFHILNDEFTTIFCAAEPRSISFIGPNRLLRSGGRIYTETPYGPGTTYTVMSEVSSATPWELIRASNVYSKPIEEKYRATPNSCWQVANLARRITVGRRNAYDRAMAIQSHLEANYFYDASAPPAPPHKDAVAYFMLESKRGYCDVFASAMVIMCRQVGIPARLATGFAAGEYDQEEQAYRVRQKDRHAWAELYFPEYGWIAFDPTPQPGAAGGIATAWVRLLEALLSSGSSVVIALALVCLMGYLLKVKLVDRWRVRRSALARLSDTTSRAVENYRRMCEFLARLGYPRQAAVTPCEYASRLAGLLHPRLSSLADAVDAVTIDFVETRYGLRDLPESRIAATASMLTELVRALNRARRQKLLGKWQVVNE